MTHGVDGRQLDFCLPPTRRHSTGVWVSREFRTDLKTAHHLNCSRFLHAPADRVGLRYAFEAGFDVGSGLPRQQLVNSYEGHSCLRSTSYEVMVAQSRWSACAVKMKTESSNSFWNETSIFFLASKSILKIRGDGS